MWSLSQNWQPCDCWTLLISNSSANPGFEPCGSEIRLACTCVANSTYLGVQTPPSLHKRVIAGSTDFSRDAAHFPTDEWRKPRVWGLNQQLQNTTESRHSIWPSNILHWELGRKSSVFRDQLNQGFLRRRSHKPGVTSAAVNRKDLAESIVKGYKRRISIIKNSYGDSDFCLHGNNISSAKCPHLGTRT